MHRFGKAKVHINKYRFNRSCYNKATAGYNAYNDGDLMIAQRGKPPRKVEL
jgi:hypothetical protein